MEWLALDLGSTYTKCARVDSKRGVLESRVERTPAPLPSRPGRYEIDAEAYFAGAHALLEEMASPDTAGVLLSTQMHGWLLTDERFRPVTPYVSWQDRASLEIGREGVSFLEEMRRRIAPVCMEKSGVPVKANLALCSLYARAQTGLEIAAGQRFCTLGGYVIGRLTGRHVCHLTNAAPSGLADVMSAAWSRERIEAAGLSALAFPQIVAGFEPVGTASLGGRALSVFPDVGDHQVCVLSAGLSRETDLNVNIGTAGLIGALTASFASGSYESRPWIEPGLYLRSVSGLPGGRQVAVLHGFYEGIVRRLVPEADAAQRAWDMMTGARAEPSLRVSPDFFSGKGRIEGIGPEFHADELTESLYAAIAGDYARAAAGLNLPLGALRFTGGCAEKNPALRRAICGALGLGGEDDAFDVMEGMRLLARMAERLV